MESLRGTKDILQNEIHLWQHVYNIAKQILTTSNYYEIRTPIIEYTQLFNRSIGYDTDIINKEMYNFTDQGHRNITLRPEGTASIARAFISNKMYNYNQINRLWYLGPMFRYERPQKGRQRQFHQLGVECLGSDSPLADTEIIRLAIKLLNHLSCTNYKLEINCIGNLEERNKYRKKLVNYLLPYINDLDADSQKRIYSNPLRILDTKNIKTQNILKQAPQLLSCLNKQSVEHFEKVCQYLSNLNIQYTINPYLVRGLDYYNYTAFEIKNNIPGQQNTICGGGRYDDLIQQIGGPKTPAVGWAIGLERLIIMIQNEKKQLKPIYIALQGEEAKMKIWDIIVIIEKQSIPFQLDLSNNSFYKQIKKANLMKSKLCLIIGSSEIIKNSITIKWLNTGMQKNIPLYQLENYLYYMKSYIIT
uniref:histidine--tRNA ligase n=1 Tax=Pleonosporium borreri TaxID=2575635 RepID=A0A4D6WYQ9_9FLOR|nr:Histidine-tRNA ligase [Pleonosporium borreri]